ncbi:MAG: hypothetical protein A2X67_03680 [Ignavibacteria bacterium GWA2_55_11]|nr:MAG: hypothetical protein A2X67_03680 [Ignavibacteria bacterium GWA2_55_11]OGU43844.1 MAG: hypothetical protein A2X68_00165 [Ignavibacteria bacterium GWC2_56_12]OGU67617.1 MAG: hypothetical protein A3C56_10955 [Ignavibacteria bacterium RIFCSPHIGHO2_02_FULL_56_12]OGU71935.1 MAG: hypothetical protein A3H45_02180 [Ignavibacteria bacterium RIFCSPLOWO2_02_FULL_55_14]OGU73129.1 MAG: hypothetical protein A3G43_04155 [Ignavibacteria bacterium RIFCSPLOWO2_12_FULL_56_21]
MRPRNLILASLVLTVLSVAYASVIKGTPEGYSIGSGILIRWITEDETGIESFVVLRKNANDAEFVVVSSPISPKGNNSTYEFLDQSVFKGSGGVFVYRVRAVKGRTPVEEVQFSVSHTSSAARRTWGSIKAMFR